MLSPIAQQMLSISDLRDIKALRICITQAINSLLQISGCELIHRLEYRNNSDAADEPTTLFSYHKTSVHGDIEKEPIPVSELRNNWPRTPSFTQDAAEPNIVPMKTKKEVVEYLIFYSDTLKTESITEVETLVKIYCNQCELILNAEQDQLTGLYNRQAFARITTAMFSTHSDSIEYRQLEKPACMAIVDLDRFKRVNDKFGHLYGDEVLLLFAQMMKKSLRNSDYIFRYGGEEFVIILNDTDPRQAYFILNRLREEAEIFNYPQIGRITISIGYAPLDKDLGVSSIIDMADSALYYSKDNGRNQINNFYELRDRGLIAEQTDDQTISIF